jgi:hypothetical protein
MIAPVQDSSMTSWPDHLPFGNQKRFKRDPAKRAEWIKVDKGHSGCGD